MTAHRVRYGPVSMGKGLRLRIAAALAALLATSAQAQVSCRGYPASVTAMVKARVEAVRLLEREAADRLRGLDTRTYPFLAGEARKGADQIADDKAIEAEREFERCRNLVQPIRRICRGAVLWLATALDEEEAGKATNESKQAYAEAMPRCEQLMGLTPLSTAWRIPN
jgi:hypothetical protein